MTELPTTISAAALHAWIVDLLVGERMPAEHATLVADALVDANLRGIDAQGVVQLRSYVALAQSGGLQVKPKIRIDFNGSMMIVQADRGFGQVVGTLAIDRAIAVADQQGFAVGTIRDVGQLGALGYFTRRAAGAGLAAMLFQNGPPLIDLPGSTDRAIGDNPLAFAAPVLGRAPIVFDMAASEALDRAGVPAQDPGAALNGITLPVGGGIGLAMMVQCFAGSLSGAVPVREEGICGAFFMLMNPAMMIGTEAFAADMKAWVDHYARSTPGGRVPGDRADDCHAERLAAGIPLSPALAAQLREDGANAGVPLPD